jgi:hypothetical protein
MMRCGSKNIFFKKLRAVLLTVKVQTHPVSSGIGTSLRTIQNIPQKVCAPKRVLICASQEAYYSVAASPKNLILALRKWKTHFSCEKKTKNGLCGVPRRSKGHTRVRYGLVPTNYIRHDQALTYLIWPKSHATSNMVGHFYEGTF